MFLSAIFGAKALKKAEGKARKEDQAGYNESIGFLEPYGTAGNAGLSSHMNNIGMGDSEAAIAAFKNSPLYRLTYDAMIEDGRRGVENTAQASGMYNSGQTLRELADEAGRRTSTLFSQYMTPQASLADMGLGVAGQKVGLRTGLADRLAQSRRNVGQIKAGQFAGFDNLINTGLSALGGFSGMGGLGAGTGSLGTTLGQKVAELSGFARSIY